jgi:hypothetical protein
LIKIIKGKESSKTLECIISKCDFENISSEDKESSDNSTKEDLEDISNQSKDIMEAYGIVGYHGACIFHVDGLHIETCRLIVMLYILGESYLIDTWLIYLLGASNDV